MSVSKEKFACPFTGSLQFFNFAIQYLCENEKVRLFTRAHVESFKPKKMVENLVTLYSDITVF